jgi:hypothetical protein
MGMNAQLESAIRFWAAFFQNYMRRPVPLSLENLDTAISYSDGEGSRAGVGVAVWSPRLPGGPLAAFLEVPEYIRRLWDKGERDDRNDIFLIEAVGPLAVLETFPRVVRNCLWVHYIDNVAAQYSLIKGSSSISSGDVVVGETWKRIQSLGIHAYFDRVESKANPVDVLSRGVKHGPWKQVNRARLPADLEEKLSAEIAR